MHAYALCELSKDAFVLVHDTEVIDGRVRKIYEITLARGEELRRWLNEDSSTELCEGEVRFTWDKGSPGFEQSSFCEEVDRWKDNGDSAATDNTTGLMWELKTGHHTGQAVQ